MRLERAVVIGVMVACPLAATIAGFHLGSSGDWHAQAPIVSDPGVLPDFSALVAAYSSAVVNIAATQTVRASDPATGGDVIIRTEGSGFVVSPSGVILTSAHLVDHADTIVVTLTDRRQFNTQMLGQDGESDVAVVDIDAEELPTVKLGESSSVKPGEWVIAIGSPFGLEGTVTSGIVSATFRYLPEKPYVPFIQTDVPMHPGNSGRPLFNMKGDVIGSGPGGQRAATQAAKLRKRVAMCEKQHDVGGVCINTGTIPSKTLREAVIDLSGRRQRTLYGETFRSKRQMRVKDLLFRAHHVMRAERDVVRAQLRRNGITLFEGMARFEGPHDVAVDTGSDLIRLNAPNVVIATGSTPAVPEGLTVDHHTVLTSDDILALPRLPRTMIVVGAGIIGVEYATMFATLGVEVTLLDKRRDLLDMVDREIVDAFTYQARELGVVTRLGQEAAQLETNGDGQARVVMNSGKRLTSDLVLVSAGRQGATDGLGLETAGVVADARGRVHVNANFETDVPGIYAVGDVIGAPSLASTSGEQGRLAACH